MFFLKEQVLANHRRQRVAVPGRQRQRLKILRDRLQPFLRTRRFLNARRQQEPFDLLLELGPGLGDPLAPPHQRPIALLLDRRYSDRPQQPLCAINRQLDRIDPVRTWPRRRLREECARPR